MKFIPRTLKLEREDIYITDVVIKINEIIEYLEDLERERYDE